MLSGIEGRDRPFAGSDENLLFLDNGWSAVKRDVSELITAASSMQLRTVWQTMPRARSDCRVIAPMN